MLKQGEPKEEKLFMVNREMIRHELVASISVHVMQWAERADAADPEPAGDAALMEAVVARHRGDTVLGLEVLETHRALSLQP